jgi:glyoxylase-like metal-dependent hydrolase (beta-lactamase superfamily II)
VAIAWRVLSIGNLSMNKFWGESERVRSAYSTCTLIETDAVRVVVDPPLPPEQMIHALYRRRGVRPEDIDLIFVTHRHGDHRGGLDAFPRAKRLMARAELESWSQACAGADKSLVDTFVPAEGALPEGIELLPTPGHTRGHTSLRFVCDGRRIVVAGDAVMTEEFFAAGEPFHSAADMASAVESMRLLRREADIVVPGHDNYFLVDSG